MGSCRISEASAEGSAREGERSSEGAPGHGKNRASAPCAWATRDFQGQHYVSNALRDFLPAGGQPSVKRDIVTLAAGRSHTCGVRTEGSVFCWGADDEGQSRIFNRSYPWVALDAAFKARAVTCGKAACSIACRSTSEPPSCCAKSTA